MDREIELWRDHYFNEDLRHFFIEHPYYTAEYLNVWMQSEDDIILDRIFPYVFRDFYLRIKDECPETVFHGIDIGRPEYSGHSNFYLAYLLRNHLEDSEQYRITLATIRQGQTYNSEIGDSAQAYRENMMAANFIREFDSLNGESAAGFFGALHTGLYAMDLTRIIPCLAGQLRERYGDAVFSEDLSWMSKETAPQRIETISVNGKEYTALYYGVSEAYWEPGQATCGFWRLENAYNDFRVYPAAGVTARLSGDYFPMLLERRQIYMIEYTSEDGAVLRRYYRYDGNSDNFRPSLEEVDLLA